MINKEVLFVSEEPLSVNEEDLSVFEEPLLVTEEALLVFEELLSVNEEAPLVFEELLLTTENLLYSIKEFQIINIIRNLSQTSFADAKLGKDPVQHFIVDVFAGNLAQRRQAGTQIHRQQILGDARFQAVAK